MKRTTTKQAVAASLLCQSLFGGKALRGSHHQLEFTVSEEVPVLIEVLPEQVVPSPSAAVEGTRPSRRVRLTESKAAVW